MQRGTIRFAAQGDARRSRPCIMLAAMPGLLPPIHTTAELDRLRSDEELWRPAMSEIARRHGLAGRLQLFPTGSAVVFSAGDERVVKLHEPWHRDLFENEEACLALVQGRLPVASPELVTAGEIEGWSYLVMTRLPGQPLSEVRGQIDRTDFLAIAREVGALAQACHALPVPQSFRPFKEWSEFIDEQRAGCSARHRANDLPEHLLATVDEQVAGVSLAADQPVFLHTELTDTNLMVARSEGHWQLSGVFDLEPSMLGHPLYDLPAVTMFVARGAPDLCRAALEASGVPRLDATLRRRLLACTLLHRYSHLGFFLRQVGVQDYPSDWDQVATALFGF